jgi:phytanoyl-CoA hydroxylase
MSFADSKMAFDRNGFVIVRELLSADDFCNLTENVDRYLRDVVPSLPPDDAFYEDRARPETLKQLHRMEQDSYFAAYCQHPRWQLLADALVGELSVAMHPEWFNKPPRFSHATPPHQDNYYFCLRPANVVTIWMALDDIDEDNGCLRYVRGSHFRGVRPHGRTATLGFSQGIFDYTSDDQAEEVSICLAPGDVVVHHGDTIHRADANQSTSRNRRAFAMVYQGVSCRRDEDAYSRYTEAAKKQRETLQVNS